MKEYKVLVNFYKAEDGGRKTEINTTFPYRPIFVFDKKNYHCQIDFEKGEKIFPGDRVEAIIRVFNCPIKIGDTFALRELKEIASGSVVSELM
ncbi:MAG: hypothetical protein IKQ13_03980 [Treponema sp.]|nr:hypothetical protein [Treponema sp.]